MFEVVYSENDFDKYDRSKKLKERKFPYSCTDEEGLIMYQAIKQFNLKSGFEVATAFGYSSLFMGLALKENRGSLVSIDCYIEEWKESFTYAVDELEVAVDAVRQSIEIGKKPIGLEYAISNRDKLEMNDIIDYVIGISPTDILKIFKNRKVDIAFIDGGHFGDQPTKDFLGILPFLEQKCVVFFHDNNQNTFVENAIKVAEENFGNKALNLNTKYNLTVVCRHINEIETKQLLNFSIRHISATYPNHNKYHLLKSYLRKIVQNIKSKI
jgi:predicted O-methyltransferase YrrM